MKPSASGQEADLARSRFGRGQQVDLAVADDPAEPRMANVHVGDRLQRRVVRVLVDQTARLDHAARRDEVALDPPHEEVPDEADHADAQRDPEGPIEERAERPGDAVVRHPSVEGAGDEPDDEREHEPPPRLEEREPVALADEQDALTRGEQRVVLRDLGVGRAHSAAPDSPTRGPDGFGQASVLRRRPPPARAPRSRSFPSSASLPWRAATSHGRGRRSARRAPSGRSARRRRSGP